jgi:hypothetical protein
MELTTHTNEAKVNASTSSQVSQEKKIRTTIYLPVSLHKAAKIYCAKTEVSMTQLIIDFLDKTVHGANS